MIIRGLRQIKRHFADSKDKKIDEWCERKGLSPTMSKAVKDNFYRREQERRYGLDFGEGHIDDQDYPGRGLEHMFFDIPN